MPTTFYEFCQITVAERLEQHPAERIGQAAFNALHAIRPDLSERIRGGEADPFHNDQRLTIFYKFLQENW